MKKIFWVIIAAGILAAMLVMWAIVSMISNMSFGIGISFGGLGIWLALAMVGVWAFLKHKKSGLAGIAGWVAIAILLFVWFGPTRTSQIAQGTGVVLDNVADSVTSVVTNGNIKTPAQIAAARKAEADELKRQQELARIQAEGEARARVAAEAAAARELEATMRDAKAVNCVRVNTDKLGCKTVTFGYNTHYDRTARYDEAANGKPAKSYCINHDGGDAVITTFLGNNQFRFTAPSGLVVQFFDLPQGESYRGVRCG